MHNFKPCHSLVTALVAVLVHQHRARLPSSGGAVSVEQDLTLWAPRTQTELTDTPPPQTTATTTRPTSLDATCIKLSVSAIQA